ncbi:capsid protein [Porcine associated circular DNA virus-7]|nr:capsid protein [Porcine associated circular DNA virus-7]
MVRYARKTGSTKKGYRRGRTYRRAGRYSYKNYRALHRRVSAISRKLAAEVCKFETTPDNYTNVLVNVTQNNSNQIRIQSTLQTPLTAITSGTPWIMPLNWIYQATEVFGTEQTSSSYFYDGAESTAPQSLTLSVRNPVWYNTYGTQTDPLVDSNDGMRSPGFQYRLKYLYLRGLFNASVSESVNNSDGAVRIVVVKDKQATGGAATWFDENYATNSRGVFNAQRIDAQLNPNTLGRFKIMYDKTLRFNTINGYKPFKYFKRLSSIVKNNRDIVYINNNLNQGNFYETNSRAPPVQKNAYYLMIFSDGLNFTYSNESSTPAASFHIFNRVSYYDN